MQNEVKFKEYMALMCEVFDRVMTNLLTDLFWKILEPYSDEQCEAAFKEVIYSSKFFPKPADFIEVLRGKKTDQATEAWIEVLGAVKRIGNYQSVKFADPVIHSVINVMGGWVKLAGDMTTEEEKWKQKEFEKLYAIMGRRGNHPDYLPGLHEQASAQHMLDDYEARTGKKYIVEVIQVGAGDFKEQKQLN